MRFPCPPSPIEATVKGAFRLMLLLHLKISLQWELSLDLLAFSANHRLADINFGCRLLSCKTDGVWISKKNYPPTFPNNLLCLVFVFKTTQDVLLLHQRVALCPGISGPFAVGGLFSQSGSRDGWKPKRHEQPHQEISIWSVGFFLRNNQQEAIFANKKTPSRKHRRRNSADFPEV